MTVHTPFAPSVPADCSLDDAPSQAERPLSASPTLAERKLKAESAAGNEEEMIWVGWDSPDDAANPLNWTKRRKWAISAVGIIYAGMVNVNVSCYSFTTPSIERELGVSQVSAEAGITLFTLTFGLAPLVLSPLSELFGRSPIYLLSAALSAIWLIPQALAPNLATLLVSRVFLGVAASTGINLAGGTLADVWSDEERSLPMSILVLSALAFTGLGPALFSYAEARYGFRLVSWCWFAASAFFFLAIIVPLKTHETRASVLLSRKAAHLRLQPTNVRYQTRHDQARPSLLSTLRTALSRPLRILATEPVVVAFTAWIAFAWAVSYLCLGSIVFVFEGVYGFGVGPTGFVYLAQVVGAVLSLLANELVFEPLRRKNEAQRGPEASLYAAMCGGVLFPLGCWIYATTARSSIHWIAPLLGLTLLYAGVYYCYLTVYVYLTKSYTLYASSALSSMNLVRNLGAAVVPLFTNPMYDKLGVQNAGILTAGFATGLSVIPFLLFVYGRGLRERSPFLRRLEEEEEEGGGGV